MEEWHVTEPKFQVIHSLWSIQQL